MIDHILVPLDGSSLAECVLPHVVSIARIFNSRVSLVQVINRPMATGQLVDPLTWQMVKIQAQNYLDGVCSALVKLGIRGDIHLLNGQPANCIIEFAHENAVKLIVLSTHGQSGLSVWNVSSVVQKVTQRAHLPLLIIRAYQTPTGIWDASVYQKILVPLDLSNRAECALPIGIRLAHQCQAQLIVAHVVPKPDLPHRTPLSEAEVILTERVVARNYQAARKYMRQIQQQLSTKMIDVQIRLVEGSDVAAALHDLVDAEAVDLVVISAHGQHGIRKWPLGHIVEKFITYGSTPLLAYQDFKPDELGISQAETTLMQIKGR